MYPHKSQQVLDNTESEYFELSQEEIEKQKFILEKESHNPYSKDEMKKYLDELFVQSENQIIDNSSFDYSKKEDVLKSLAAVSYAKENDYLIETDGTYLESENFLTKHWRVKKLTDNESINEYWKYGIYLKRQANVSKMFKNFIEENFYRS